MYGVFVKGTGKLLAAFAFEGDAWSWLLGSVVDRRRPDTATEKHEVRACNLVEVKGSA
jgi:hypothetical protein